MRPLLVFVFSAALYAAPCTVATTECTEFVALNGGPARTMVYRNQSLTQRNDRITRGLIVIHGTNRDADNYFRSTLAAAFLAEALEDTAIIVPHIASSAGGCRDTLAANEVSWNCNSWRTGGASMANEKLTSFDMVDELMRRLADRKIFPNLRLIVLAGHSAGGQFVNRYEMSNQIHEKLGVPIRYVVSNPSSYAWIDATRPTGEVTNCPNYNHWPYGFEARSGAAARLSEEVLTQQLASRPTIYLLGEIDILPLGGFDASCSAMAQGPTRLARGQAYARHVNEKLNAKHQTVIVPLCGHNARCMFGADISLPLLFPREVTTTGQ